MSPTSDYEDRRQFPRSGAVYRLDVCVPRSKANGYMADVSLGGLQVRYTDKDAFEGVERIRIEFPRWLGLGRGVTVSGHVVWFRQAGRSSFECGFCFDALSGEKRKLFQALIDGLTRALEEDGLAPFDARRPELDDEVSLSVFL